MRYFFIAALLALTGCDLPPVAYKPQEVDVPVEEPCKVQMPAEPAWPVDKLKTSSSMVDKARAFTAQNEFSKAYQARLRAAILACTNLASK